MHIFGVEGNGLGAVAVIDIARLHTGSADYVILRQSDLHVIGAEVGKKLGQSMELVAIPPSVPPNLGKPLPSEQKGALVSGARNNFGEGCLEFDFELHIRTRRNRTRQLHLENRLVVWIAIIR